MDKIEKAKFEGIINELNKLEKDFRVALKKHTVVVEAKYKQMTQLRGD